MTNSTATFCLSYKLVDTCGIWLDVWLHYFENHILLADTWIIPIALPPSEYRMTSLMTTTLAQVVAKQQAIARTSACMWKGQMYQV